MNSLLDVMALFGVVFLCLIVIGLLFGVARLLFGVAIAWGAFCDSYPKVAWPILGFWAAACICALVYKVVV